MARDLSAYLQDVLEDCNSIEYVISGVSLDEYRSKRASVTLTKVCLVPYPILVRSLFFGICLLITMEQLMTMRF